MWAAANVADVVRRLRSGEFTGGEPIEHFVLLLQEAYRRDTAVPAQIPRGFPAPDRIAARIGRGPGHRAHRGGTGLALFYVPAMRNGIASVDPEDRGNAILSTLDLRDPVVVELPMEHQRRAAVRRNGAGAGARRIAVDAFAWRTCISTRRSRSLGRPVRGPPASGPRADRCARHPGRMTPRSWRRFQHLVGPHRAGGEAPARRISADAAAPRTLATWRGPLGLHAQLDYIFLRGALAPAKVKRLPSRFGSDHYPLLAVVTPHARCCGTRRLGL